MKKIIAVVSVFAVAALATSTFATEGWVSGDVHTKIKVENRNTAVVMTAAATAANTGGNEANGKVYGSGEGSARAKGGSITTGEAAAETDVLVGVNANATLIDNTACGCARDGDTETEISVKNHNDAVVMTEVLTAANTGGNEANGKVSGSGEGSKRAKGGSITTGDAVAVTQVGVMANSNVTEIYN